ncbi:DUF1062 domain-containing protein [Streptomyces sp. NPDC008317]|uniref:DUF1062 domain-containing protein n=1 Tax=unclassified Streptomyces TaxID=2593676 RepID=UPI0036E1140C
MSQTWVVAPTCPPLVVRRCHSCPSDRFRASGRFRVNAHHKSLDVWLLVLCAGCGETAKLTVFERVNVRSLRPDLLDRLHTNDPGLTAELLRHPAVRHRNGVALDWTDAWRLDITGPAHADDEALEVSVRFAAHIPLRPVRLIADGLGVSRAEVKRLIDEGKIVSAHRLSGKAGGDFTFLLKL